MTGVEKLPRIVEHPPMSSWPALVSRKSVVLSASCYSCVPGVTWPRRRDQFLAEFMQKKSQVQGPEGKVGFGYERPDAAFG